MKRFLTFPAVALAFLLLAGCGFKPMYADGGADPALTESFAGIDVAPISDRIGQVVQNHLLDSITPYGRPSAPGYVLNIQLVKATEGFGFRSDESITRESMTLEAAFRLTNLKTGEVVLEDMVRAVHTYDVVQSDFANFSAQEDAEARTALRVSDLITANLAMFFKSKP